MVIIRGLLSVINYTSPIGSLQELIRRIVPGKRTANIRVIVDPFYNVVKRVIDNTLVSFRVTVRPEPDIQFVVMELQMYVCLCKQISVIVNDTFKYVFLTRAIKFVHAVI